MNRRLFIQTILGSVAAAAVASELDPERLLWVPGSKTIFLPAPKTVETAELIQQPTVAVLEEIAGSGGRYRIVMNEGAFEHARRHGDQFAGWNEVYVQGHDGRLRGVERAKLHAAISGRLLEAEAKTHGSGFVGVRLTDREGD